MPSPLMSMPRFERSGKGKRDSKSRSPRGESKNFEDYARDRKSSGGRSSSRPRRSFGGNSRGRRDSGRESGRPGRSRNLKMTKVTCDSCGIECEVPFKPTSNKPVYCSDCFEKRGKGSSGRSSDKRPDRDLDIINEKLNKIMKALKIE